METVDLAPPIIIRDAVSGDKPMLVAFMGELQRHYTEMDENRTIPEEMAQPQVEALEEWCSGADGGFLVAEMQGSVVGFVAYGVLKRFGFSFLPENRSCGWISDLFVDQSHRERGIGRRMMAEAENRLRASGVKQIEINTLFENIEGRAFYESEGYTPDHVQYAKQL